MTLIRPRRSVLYMPGSNPRALEKAKTLPADVVVLDLEDAVAPDAKKSAREAVAAAVREGYGPREVVVRINSLLSEWGESDLAAMIKAKPDALLLPKVASSDDVMCVEAGLDPDDEMALWAMIETPKGVMNLDDIAATGGRLEALVLGSNDLIKETGGRHMASRANLFYAMSAVVTAARANGLAVIDGVHNDIADGEGFAAACEQGRDFGFDGKTLIHPSQIEPCNSVFAPSTEEIAAAEKIVAAFAAHPGAGVLAVDGRMVERLHAEVAEKTLSLAKAIAAR